MKKAVLLFILFPVILCAQSTTQMQLVTSARFQNRIAYLLSQQAVLVKAEPLSTVCHVKRSAFADSVIGFPQTTAQSTLVILAGSTNVVNTVTIINNDFDSSATDAALASQVNTLWNVFSKCDTGS